MRARYSAHVLQLVDFVINTYHPSCGAEQQRTEITESIQSHWCGLDVISAERGRCADEGYVHFKAYYQQDGHQFCLEEKSRFVRLDNLWYYIDGQFPDLDEPFRD
jgi:SEC-C motif-containing protein